MLEIKDLSLTYQGTRILEELKLEGSAGEIILLTGCSGSGKSSLLRVLNGLIPEIYRGQSSGSVRLDGEELLGRSVADISRSVSTVFQNPKTQFYCVNTTDEMIFAMENRAIPVEMMRRRLKQYTEALHTGHLLERNIFALSGGEKQLVAITGAAMLENRLYLLDEPSASLDKAGISRLRNALSALKQEGKLIIVAEHRMYYLADLADKLAVLEQGRLTVFAREELNRLPAHFLEEKYCLRSFSEPGETQLAGLEHFRIQMTGRTGSAGTSTAGEKRRWKYTADKMNTVGCQGRGEVLCCRDFSVRYGKNTVLALDLSFGEGIHFITGENGVGKTSFINRLTGIVTGRGKVYYRGKRVRRAGDIMSLVMQDVNYQIFTESVWHEISIVCQDEAKKQRILEELGLYDKRDEHPQILSGGEKQRLMIGLTRAGEKPVVILDEPTSGLCRKQMLTIVGYLRAMAAEGKLVIVVTHDRELIKACGGCIYEFVK